MYLLNCDKKVLFYLGEGDWSVIFPYNKFKMTDLFSSELTLDSRVRADVYKRELEPLVTLKLCENLFKFSLPPKASNKIIDSYELALVNDEDERVFIYPTIDSIDSALRDKGTGTRYEGGEYFNDLELKRIIGDEFVTFKYIYAILEKIRLYREQGFVHTPDCQCYLCKDIKAYNRKGILELQKDSE